MGTTHKLVSVIVPVFNVFPWLRDFRPSAPRPGHLLSGAADRVSANGDIRMMVLQGLHGFLNHFRTEGVIRIQKRNDFSRHALKPRISRSAQTAVVLMKNADEIRPSARIFVTNLSGSVRGAVIHQQNLQVVVALAHDALQALVQIILDVIDGNDD